jgi:hypothetical protein
MRTIILFVAVSICISFAAVPASGKGKMGYPNSGNSTRTQPPQQQQPPATPTDTPQSKEDQKQLQADRLELTKAQDALNAVANKLKTAFESSPDRKATVVAARQADAEYEPLKSKVLDVVHKSAAYKAAVEERDQLTAALAADGATADGSGDPQAATKRLEANTKVTKLEIDALSADPGTAEAQHKRSDVAAKLSAEFVEFQQSLTTNPNWAAAKETVDKAKAKVDADTKKNKGTQAIHP